MNPADEMAAKMGPTEHPSAGAAAGVIDKLDEQLRVSVEALLHPSPPSIPAEEVDDLLLAISRHIDDEASERKTIRNRLLAIENTMERLASRGFRYLVAICIGVAAILAWQSYGGAAKQVIATRAPELGWSPEAKQRIAGWMQQPGWTKPLVVESKPAPVTQTAPETVAAKAPAAPSLDPQQVKQIGADIAAVRQAVERRLGDVRATVERLAANQDQMAREIEKLQAADMEILEKISTPPLKRAPLPRASPRR
jgi:pimeloyl-ACP methyl ester carboxylesterase